MYLFNEYEDNRIEYIWLKVRCTSFTFLVFIARPTLKTNFTKLNESV